MKARRYPFLAVLLLMLGACKPCGLAKATADFVHGIVKPVMAIASPVLPPQLIDRYKVLQATFDVTSGALSKACEEQADASARLLAATNAAVELIEWYRENRPDREMSERILESRGLAMPRGTRDDLDAALSKAGGGKPKAIDLDKLLADLKAKRTELQAK